MGKVKGKRRLHAAAPQLETSGSTETEAISTKTEAMDIIMDDKDKISVVSAMKKKAASVAPSKAGTNPFRGMKINTDSLKQVLPDFDTRSTVTSKTFQGLNLKKKDKMKLRHDLWIEKVDTLQNDRKERRAKKKRAKTAVVGDMQVIADALPTLELLNKTTSATILARDREAKIKKRSKAVATEKERQKTMVDNVKLFQQVLEVPQFKANPAETILEHLKNKLKQEEEAAEMGT